MARESKSKAGASKSGRDERDMTDDMRGWLAYLDAARANEDDIDMGEDAGFLLAMEGEELGVEIIGLDD